MSMHALISPPRLFMILAYLLVSIAYLMHGWGHELASMEGDEFIYLLSAEHFSLWTEPSVAAAYVASNSPSPPLFPLVLGLMGGANSILAANIIVAVLMLLSFVAFFCWLLAEKISEWRAFLLTFLFAILPGTYMQALFVMSEGLFLILSMSCLLAVAKAENSRNDRWLVTAALCVAAAILTRSAGWALLAAFALYLIWHRRQRIWLLLTIAVLPVIVWSGYKHAAGGTDVTTYSGLFLEWYTNNPIWASASPLSILFNQVITEIFRLWKGLSADFTTSPVGESVFGIIGILFLSAVAYRVYLRKLDGIYAAVYLGMILVWPFSYAANAEKRFALVIIPVLMFQALFLTGRVHQNYFHRLRFNPAEIVYLFSVLLLALPTLALMVSLHFQPVEQELEPFRKVGWWYKWYWKDSVMQKNNHAKFAKVLAEGLPAVGSRVPEHECVHSVLPYAVSFYMKRIVKYPPKESLGDADFLRAVDDTGCRYFFFMNYKSPSFSMEPYYPVLRLGDAVQPLVKLDYSEGEAKVVIGILGKLK